MTSSRAPETLALAEAMLGSEAKLIEDALTLEIERDPAWWFSLRRRIHEEIPSIAEDLPLSGSNASARELAGALTARLARSDDWKVLLTRAQFLVHDQCIRDLLEKLCGESLTGLIEEIRVGKQNPYRGLARFERENRDIYHPAFKLLRGTKQVNIDDPTGLALAVDRIYIVLGPPGSGKSSLIQAYLLPAVAGRSDVIEINCEELSFERPVDGLLKRLSESRSARLTGNTATPRETRRVLLVLDQFEALIAGCAHADMAGLLNRLVEMIDAFDDIDIVLTMHDHDEPRTSELQEFMSRFEDCTLRLVYVDSEPLRAAIRKPALAFGVPIDDALIDMLVDDLAGQLNMLPLLQLTLAQLFQRAHEIGANQGTRPRMNAKLYQQSSIRHAVTEEGQRIERETEAQELEGLFVHFVSCLPRQFAHETVQFARRRAPAAAFENRSIVARMLERRLLTQVGTNLELTHDIVLRSWTRLSKWSHDNSRVLEICANIRIRRWRWVLQGRSDDQLLTASETDEVDKIPENFRAALSDDEKRYVDISRHRFEFRRVMLVTGAATLAAVAAVLIYSWWVASIAQDLNNAVGALAGDARRAMRYGAPMQALTYAIETAELAPADAPVADRTARQVLIDVLLDINPSTVVFNADTVDTMALSPDGRSVAIAHRGTLHVVSLDTGSSRWLGSHERPIEKLEWSRDGRSVLSVALGEGVSLTFLAVPVLTPVFAGEVSDARFVPSAPNRVLVVSRKNSTLWDVSEPDSPQLIADIAGGMAIPLHHDRRIMSFRGEQLVAWTPDGEETIAVGIPGNVFKAEVSPGDRWLLLRTGDGLYVMSLDAHGPYPLHEPARRIDPPTVPKNDSLTAFAFAPDDSRLYTGSRFGTVVAWRLDEPSLPLFLTRHEAEVRSIVAFPNRLYTGSVDGTAKSIGLHGDWPDELHYSGHEGQIRTVLVDPDEQFLLTASFSLHRGTTRGPAEGMVRRWSASPSSLPVLIGKWSDVDAVAISPDGTEVAIAADKQVVFWSWPERRRLRVVEADVERISYAADGGSAYGLTWWGKLLRLDQNAKIILDLPLIYEEPRFYDEVLDFAVDNQGILLMLSDGRFLSGVQPGAGDLTEYEIGTIEGELESATIDLSCGVVRYRRKDKRGGSYDIGDAADEPPPGACDHFFTRSSYEVSIWSQNESRKDTELRLSVPGSHQLDDVALDARAKHLVASTEGGSVYFWTLDKDEMLTIARPLVPQQSTNP